MKNIFPLQTLFAGFFVKFLDCVIVKFNSKCYHEIKKLLKINSINKGEIFYAISNEV